MKKHIILITLFLLSIGLKAHQADVSTTMLVEKDNGTWVLQISSSLTAFQQEISTHFAETPYKTPEEFQQMVLTHIINKFHLEVNGGQELSLSDGIIRLGHETKVVFEVLGMPKELKSIVVQNNVFEDIHRNQSALLLLKEGFNKKHFVLNNANQHTIALKVDGINFEIDKNKAGLTSLGLLILILSILGVVFLVYKLIANKSFTSKNEELVPMIMLKKID